MTRPATFAAETIGCRVNQCETAAIVRALEARGLRPVGRDEGPAVYVLNSCAVTEDAEREARRRLRRARREIPGVSIVVTGCYATRAGAAAGAFAEADLVLPNAAKERVADAVIERLGTLPAELATVRSSRTTPRERARAVVKIQDGCNRRCAFCIVPLVRGASRCRPPAEILDEVRCLADAGHREIVLAGVCLGQYGHGRSPGAALPDLLARAAEVPGVGRVRLSSIEAGAVTDDLLSAMASHPNICPHLHIPLQSGDDEVLRAMDRRPSVARFLEVLAHVRERLDKPAISTDVIVGFPGEGPAAFERTVATCREAGFMRIHVFPYSDRPGTRAAGLGPKVPRLEIRRRRDALLALGRSLAADYARRFAGETAEVAVEMRRDPRTGLLTGYTSRYLRVVFEGPDSLCGGVVRVRLDGAEGLPGAVLGTLAG